MLRFLDGFDHYNTLQVGRKWSFFEGAISPGTGRKGTASLRTTNYDQTPYLDFDNQGTWIVGFAFNPAGLGADGWGWVRFGETSGTIQCVLSLGGNGDLLLYRGLPTSNLLARSTQKLLVNNWYFIEVKATIHNTTGLFEVRVGGVVWATFSGNTRGGSNNYANRILLNDGSNTTKTFDWDDFYVCDGTGSRNNDYLGEGHVDLVLPNGAGTYSEWTPSAGANYQNVDDNPSNDDADYNSSAVAGQRDSYAYPDIATPSGLVKAVAVNLTVGKDDLGARNVQSLVRAGGADYVGASRGLVDGYRQYTEFLEIDPSTGLPWTVAGVNSAEYGIKLVS